MNPDDDLPPLPDLPRGRYRHYKGGQYEVVGVARHSETLAPQAVYRPLYNASGWWVRPLDMFCETVTVEGVEQPRFAPLPPEDPTSLCATLQALEAELHHAGRPCPVARAEALLHPDFHEVGRSGRPYDRATVLAYLAGAAAVPPTVSWGHQAVLLAPGVAWLTFRSAQRQDDGRWGLDTLRCSLWLQDDAGGWRLRYHQGTPAAEPADPPAP